MIREIPNHVRKIIQIISSDILQWNWENHRNHPDRFDIRIILPSNFLTAMATECVKKELKEYHLIINKHVGTTFSPTDYIYSIYIYLKNSDILVAKMWIFTPDPRWKKDSQYPTVQATTSTMRTAVFYKATYCTTSKKWMKPFERIQ